jgi:chromosome segregation ATPase
MTEEKERPLEELQAEFNGMQRAVQGLSSKLERLEREHEQAAVKIARALRPEGDQRTLPDHRREQERLRGEMVEVAGELLTVLEATDESFKLVFVAQNRPAEAERVDASQSLADTITRHAQELADAQLRLEIASARVAELDRGVSDFHKPNLSWQVRCRDIMRALAPPDGASA